MSSKSRRTPPRQQQSTGAPGLVVAAWRRATELVSPDTLAAEINRMVTSQRRFVLRSIGARDAREATRPMAAQVLARMRTGAGGELASAVCLQGWTVFTHDLTDTEWADLVGEDPLAAARVLTDHRDLSIMLHDIAGMAPELQRLHLAAGAITGEGLGATVALGLLAAADPDVAATYRSAREGTGLPEQLHLADLAPATRLTQIGGPAAPGHDLAELDGGSVLGLLESRLASLEDVDVADVEAVLDGWDDLHRHAQAVADALADGLVPSFERVEELREGLARLNGVSWSASAGSREEFARWLTRARALTTPAWAVRLAGLTGPEHLSAAVAQVAAMAEQADEQPGQVDEALRALLAVIDAAAAVRDGKQVDAAALLRDQGIAAAGLPDHADLVLAAAQGHLDVPAAPTTTEPAPETAETTGPVPDERAQDAPTTPAPDERAQDAQTDPAPEATAPETTAGALDAPDDTADVQPTPGPGDQTTETGTDPTIEADLGDLDLPATVTRYATTTAPTQAPGTATAAGTDDAEPQDVDGDAPDDEAGDEPETPTWGTGSAAATDQALIGAGRYALAADLADTLAAPPASVAARRLAAYAAHLREPVGPLATRFSTAATEVTRDALGEDRPGQLLAWAAAAKAALLAPSAGPANVLTTLTPCVASSADLEEVTAALLEACRAGVVVVAPEAAAAAGASSAAHARAAELAEKANDLATRAKHRTLKYVPAGEVYNAWLAPGGALHDVLQAVRDNDPGRVKDVARAIVEDLRGKAEKNIDTVFAAQNRTRGRGVKIVAQPRQQLVSRWDEIVDLAAEWVATREEIAAQEAAATGSWHHAALTRLRHRVDAHRAGAVTALAGMLTAAGVPADEPVRLLTDTFAALDGELPPQGEPPVAYAEHAELLALPVPLDQATLTPEAPLDPAALIALAATDPPGPHEVYASLAGRGAHDLTAALVAGLRAVDPDAATALDARRTQDVFTTDTTIRDQLTELAGAIDTARVEGVLGDQVWARLSDQLEALTDTTRRDYERISAHIRAIRDAMDTERATRIEETVTWIREQAATHADVATHAQALIDLARAGQVSSAQEQVQQILEGNPIVTAADRPEHLRVFFPTVPTVLGRHQRPLDQVLTALGSGEHTDVTGDLAAAGVDVLALTPARRKQAREALTAFGDLAAPKPNPAGGSDIDKLKAVLRQAGVEFRDVHVERGQRDRQTVVLRQVETLGHALTPTLGSDRSPDGSLRVMLVRKAATPASIIESLAAAPKDSTVVVLWLAPAALTPADWHAIAEAARGRPRPPAVFVDLSVMVYLCAQAEPRLATLAAITLPFTAANPYKDTAGYTAPEMFYGRAEERAAIMDMSGPSIVSGGRQLGKSALLRDAAARFNATSPDHVAVVMSIFQVGRANPVDGIWPALWAKLTEAGVLTAPMPEQDVAQALHAAVREWVRANPARQLLLLLDEADDFLDADAQGNRFEQVEWFRQLMLDTNRAVKVVLAGLHGTARFEAMPNQPLSHLGRPVVVGPLRPQHARALLTEPLAAIGYTFDSDVTVAKVLAEANNMPAQLQLIGQALVARMSAKALDPAGPPTVITADDVDAAFDPRLRDELRNKFTLTLALDPRYKVIAYVIAHAAHERGPDVTLSVAELFNECRAVWPTGFTGVGQDAFRSLVDECVALGVLAADGTQYRLRTPAVRRLLGTELEVLEELTNAAATLTVPAPYDGSVFRRSVERLERAISPLTERQLGQVFARDAQVTVIAGSTATGLPKVIATLEEVADVIPHGKAPVRVTNTRPEALAAQIAKGTDGTRLLVDARTASPAHLRDLLDAAEAATAATGREVTTLIVAGPASAPTWVTHPRTVHLERVSVTGIRLLTGADLLPFHDAADQERAAALTGGWLSEVSRLADMARAGTHRYAADLLDAAAADIAAHPGRLATDAGLDPTGSSPLLAVFTHVADLTAATPEALDDLALLLEVAAADDATLAGALGVSGFAGARRAVDALVALGALTETTAGRWAAEPVLAGDVARARA